VFEVVVVALVSLDTMLVVTVVACCSGLEGVTIDPAGHVLWYRGAAVVEGVEVLLVAIRALATGERVVSHSLSPGCAAKAAWDLSLPIDARRCCDRINDRGDCCASARIHCIASTRAAR
jgi:hypothetical protein